MGDLVCLKMEGILTNKKDLKKRDGLIIPSYIETRMAVITRHRNPTLQSGSTQVGGDHGNRQVLQKSVKLDRGFLRGEDDAAPQEAFGHACRQFWLSH